MAREDLKPQLETLEVVKNEQMEALADAVHRDILNILQETGACTPEEISRALPLGKKETDEYLSGLEAVGLLDRVIEEGVEYYLPRARSIAVKTAQLPGDEGIGLVREFLVERVAEMAQELSRLEAEDVSNGSITLHQVKMAKEDMDWVNERLNQAFREITDYLEKNKQEKEAHCRLAFFFYPVKE